ncbi:glycosyltransferase [Microbacterium sp. BG28]|uniref:glycosyltransferase n=1 Tax=Microbacterium sp. BG28 TaxID=3097356 RepID=UPI002A59B6AD|nr:glycosyltransferase [Microbacterium sp. BG28]MDY0830363.1 glycosyltransferase [Microbacterium sp. BG28]
MSADMTTVSVCMATYNGAAYVVHQLQSILAELRPDDEIVVVDDASIDETVQLVRSIDDDRIRVIAQQRNAGYVASFARALAEARGDVLMLSDQDDEWVPGRRALLVAALGDADVVASNLEMLGTGAPLTSPLTGKPWVLMSSDSPIRRQLAIFAGVAPYYGCAMALRRSALTYLLPFPDGLRESHDLWIATAANAQRRLAHVGSATVRRRVHESNASTSSPRGVRAALRSRLLMLQLWREARRRRAAQAGGGAVGA